MKGAWLMVFLLGSGCGDTGAVVEDVELRVSGSASNTVEGRNGWDVELRVAELAFGPLTFCPGRTAGEFCDAARGEWLDSVVVDALSGGSKRAGYVVATSGPALSWMYDYGFVSLLTQNEPLEMDAAAELGGNSVVLQGCARKEQASMCFSLETKVAQTTNTEQGVPVVRLGGLEGIDDLATLQRIAAQFEVGDWLSTVDFDQILTERQGQGFDCSTDCDDIELEPDSQAARAVQTALGGRARPTLSWK